MQQNSFSIDRVDHVNVKIFAREPVQIDVAEAIPVFHRWIQEAAPDDLLIDVADYRHVPAGPGVLLIGYEANYSLDFAFGQLGLLYNRKLPLEGGFEDKLRQAYGAAAWAANRLEEEAVFEGKLRFDTTRCEIVFNDRYLAPNTGQTWLAIRPGLTKFFDELFAGSSYSMEHVGSARERLRVEIGAV
jgi:hypothetical protein